jgi:hypothetical protein
MTARRRRHAPDDSGPVVLEAVLPSWLLARLLVSAALLAAVLIADRLLPGQTRPLRTTQGLFAWDATWYYNIANSGYRSVGREGLRFFPLYPLAARILAVGLLGNIKLAMLLLSNGFALAASVLAYRRGKLEFGSDDSARRVALYLALAPAGFVLVFGYAESMLLFFALACFMALRKGHWIEAAAVGFAAGLAHPLGALLAVPALVEVLLTWTNAKRRRPTERFFAVVAPPAGSASYLLWSAIRFHTFTGPLRELQHSRGGLVDPVTRLWHGLRDALGSQSLRSGLHFPFAVLVVGLAVAAWFWLPRAYAAYASAVVLWSISSTNWDSLERYAMTAFPLVMVLAMFSAKYPRSHEPLLVVMSSGVAVLALLSFCGVYVP